MEPTLETIVLDAEENNELLFKVKVEGADNVPAKVRLVCESGELAYMFNGYSTSTDGVVAFNLPPMKDKLKEGVYASRIEVLIENKYFAPVEFNINFKKVVKVVAESINIAPRKAPEMKVTASVVVAQRPQPVPTVVPPVIKQVETVVKPKPVEQEPQKKQSLRERFQSKPSVIEDDVDESDENLIRELARSFINVRKR